MYLLVADTYPEALEGASPSQASNRQGRFNFVTIDDGMASELEALIVRLFEHYQAAHAES